MKSTDTISRQRHLRLIWYTSISFVLTLFGYYLLDFDWLHAIGYATTAFVLLIGLNYKSVLVKVDSTSATRSGPSS